MPLYGRSAGGTTRWPQWALVAGASLWGVAWVPLRAINGAGLAGLWLIFVLYASAGLAGAASMVGTPQPSRPPWRALGALALCSGWTNVAFLLAILHGPVVRVMLLFYLSPVWTVGLARIFLKEPVTTRAWAAVGAALTGALLLLWRPGSGLGPFSTGDWLALSSGFAFSVANILTRGVHGASVAMKSLAVWGGVVVLAGLWLIGGQVPWPEPPGQVLAAAMALGVAGIGTLTWLIQYGVSQVPARRSAVIMLVELVAGAVSQTWLTSERLTLGAWLGAALIVGASVHAARDGSEAPG